MGMYDRVYVLDGLRCASGHLHYDFQTKSLSRSMDGYYVVGKALYRAVPQQDDRTGATLPSFSFVFVGKNKAEFSERTTTCAERSELSAEVEVHTICHECLPVFTRGQSYGGTPDISEHRPFVSWNLKFDSGKLVEAKMNADGRGSESTREAIRKHLVEQGSYVLDDDDPRVVEWGKEQYGAGWKPPVTAKKRKG